tara:strand:+ start:1812 stop:2282 length:471 start_codon:yes stop_codon:yes gene_type:complete
MAAKYVSVRRHIPMRMLGGLAHRLTNRETIRQGERLFGNKGRAFLGMIDGQEFWSDRFLDDTGLAAQVLNFEQAAFDARQEALPDFLRGSLSDLESDLGVAHETDATIVSQAAQLARALQDLQGERRLHGLCLEMAQGLHQVSWLRRAGRQGLIVQ